MIVDEPLGLFITWTCYGTWLPGDERGYVANTLLPHAGWESKENAAGAPYRADDAHARERARFAQKGGTVLLTKTQARCAAESLVQAAACRSWRIYRGAVMANHVHLVVLDSPDDGPGVRRILKGNAQAALSDQLGENRRWWTAGGSNRYLHGEKAILDASDYVREQIGMLIGIDDMRVYDAG